MLLFDEIVARGLLEAVIIDPPNYRDNDSTRVEYVTRATEGRRLSKYLPTRPNGRRRTHGISSNDFAILILVIV